MENNINRIVASAHCTACGACAGICPVHAINMKENAAGFLMAAVDKTLCVQCGKCLTCCPSNAENKIAEMPAEPFRGKVQSAYIGYNAVPEVRLKGQSGGVVTGLLCYLLESKRIDRAIINHFNPSTQRPEAVCASTADELIGGCGSYYAQTAVVEKICSTKGKMVAVALGCQAEALELMRENGYDISSLKYTIGLFCAGQNSGHMIDTLIMQADSKIENKDVKEFRFRDKCRNGWPGNVRVNANDKDHWLTAKHRHILKPVYEAHRCLLCYDETNLFADIACGDPWGIQHEGLKDGYTVILARTEKGKRLLEEAEKAGYIVLEEIEPETVFKGQSVDTYTRPKVIAAKAYCERNGFPWPYNESLAFEEQEKDKAPSSKWEKRLNWTKEYYFADSKRAGKLARRKYYSLRARRVASDVFRFPIRVIRWSLRKIKRGAR